LALNLAPSYREMPMPLGNLTDCEKELVRCTREGEIFSFEHWADGEGLTEQARDAARSVDGAVIATLLRGDLCLSGAAPICPHPRGLRAVGIALPGGLDIALMALVAPIELTDCEIHELYADSARIHGDLSLDTCTIATGVNLVDACIDGSLMMYGTRLGAPSALHGLRADGLTVKGSVLLTTSPVGRRFEADGWEAIRLLGASIGGVLDLQSARIGRPNADRALNAARLAVGGDVFLKTSSDGTRFEAEGREAVCLVGATIDGSLECQGARLGGPMAQVGLIADRLIVKGSVFLNTSSDGVRFEAEGREAVRLPGATIERQLTLQGARLGGQNAEGGLTADGLTVKGDVFLAYAPDGTCFEAEGRNAVRLQGATIAGQFGLVGANLTTTKGKWLDLSDTHLSGPFIARSNRFSGEDGCVDLTGAHVHELADQRDGWPNGKSLRLDGLVYRRFANCEYGFRKHWIGQQVPEHLGQRPNSGGRYDLRPQPFEQCASVLRAMGHPIDASRILIDKQRKLQEKRLAELRTFDLVTELWQTFLSSNPRATLNSLIRIRRNWPATRLFGRWLWHLILGLTTSFGFRRGLPVVWFLGLVLLGWPLYELAHANRIMVPSQPIVLMSKAYNADDPKLPDGYPEFHSLAYSFDVALPLIDLYQEPFWQPAGNIGEFSKGPAWLTGGTVRFLHILHIILGWGFASLLVAGLAGLIRQD